MATFGTELMPFGMGMDFDVDRMWRMMNRPDIFSMPTTPLLPQRSDWGSVKSHFHPRTDLFIEGNTVHVELELPGIPKENIDVNVTEDTLTLSTNKQLTKEERRGDYFLSERNFGNYFRRLYLPEKVDSNRVDATLTNGVLRIRIPLLRGTTQTPKRIEITDTR